MTTATVSHTPASQADLNAQEANAAVRANTAEAKAENLKQLDAMSEEVTPAQQAEHIRSVAAMTLAHLSDNAPTSVREQAEGWHSWALGLAQDKDRSAAV